MTKSSLLSEEVILQTPWPALAAITSLGEKVKAKALEAEDLRARLNQNSTNSNRPPSPDSPFQKKLKKQDKGKPGAKKGHKGQRQALLSPTVIKDVRPRPCP